MNRGVESPADVRIARATRNALHSRFCSAQKNAAILAKRVKPNNGPEQSYSADINTLPWCLAFDRKPICPGPTWGAQIPLLLVVKANIPSAAMNTKRQISKNAAARIPVGKAG
jgi:hypothetical protein